MSNQQNDVFNETKQDAENERKILYLLLKEKTIATYEDKEEAEADMENNRLWYPENNYRIIQQQD